MRCRPALPIVLALALAATGCAASGGGTATSASAPATTTTAPQDTTPPPTPTVDPVTAAFVSVSVSAVTARDADGAALASAPFSDGAAVLTLLSTVIGSTPTPQASQFATTLYDWGGLILVVSDGGSARISIGATSLNGLQLRADAGIAVGTAVGAAVAQGATAGPGDPTVLRLEVTEAPGTMSSQEPGQVGVDFVGLVTDGTTITRILAPADDYSDL